MTDSLSLTNSNDNDSLALLSDATSLMTDVAAEALLASSPALGQVLALRDTLSRASDGTLVDYDTAGLRIKEEVAELPILELQNNITPGTEGAYQRQLLHALEKINDDHDRVMHKLLKLKSRLVNAMNVMKNHRVQFTAFYSLAFNAYINAMPKGKRPKFTVKQVEAMGDGEFSRLMDNLDSTAPSLISELEILEDIIKTRKKAQAAKYQLGKDQVSTMWTSFQSHGSIGLDDDPNALLKKFPVEEDDDEIPSFVSKHTKEVRVAASSSLVVPPTRLCSVCGEKQFDSPSGVTCINGHGGAPEASEIKGTFVKHGDPKPITPIVDDEGELLFVPKKMVVKPNSDLDVAKLTVIIKAGEEHVCGGDEPVVVNHEAESVEVKEYRPKFNLTEVVDTILTPTKTVEIEDIPDYPPHTQKEAVEIMEKETIREPEKQPEFKPIPAKLFVLPEGVKPVENIEDILNDPPALATTATTTPRRKLMLLDEDEL